MSDFFEGLAARSTGAATALRPRIASAYETHDAMEVAEEVPAAPMHAEAPEPQTIVRDVVLTIPPPPPQVAPQDPEEVPPQKQPVEPSEWSGVASAHRPSRENFVGLKPLHSTQIEQVREVLAVPETPARRREGRAEAHPTLQEGRTEAHPTLSAIEETEASEATAPPRRPLQILTQPPQPEQQPHPRALTNRQPTTDNRQPILPHSAPPDPIVRITIGRVEVRAVQPAQPAPRPAPPPPPPGPTLEEFLEQRERRR